MREFRLEKDDCVLLIDEMQSVYAIVNFMLNDQVKKIVVINKPIGESLDENGFTIIGATEFLRKYLKCNYL